ncbi:MAG: sulfotransferase, partial [Gammaproteobacteria bacterium]|nr:sulfotransferase [Gammaproteobacteria bacterium]
MSNADTQVQSPEPFFVIGSPRSGTTLLRLILTSHPQIVVPPECGFVTWLYPTFGEWGLSEFTIPENIERFATAVKTS